MGEQAPQEDARRRAKRSNDPRAERVRNDLFAAAERMGLQGLPISVSSLVQQAGVSRSAFYVHFADLGDFALRLQQLHFDAIAQAAEADLLSDPGAAMLQSQRDLVAHFAANRDLYRLAFSVAGTTGIGEDTAAALERAIRRHIDLFCSPPPGIRPDLASAYIAGAATNLIAAWLLGTASVDEETLAQHLFALMPPWMHDGGRAQPPSASGRRAPEKGTNR
ncbi:TetR/AcrR family transcriptional regulator [Leucobacter sp.]